MSDLERWVTMTKGQVLLARGACQWEVRLSEGTLRMWVGFGNDLWSAVKDALMRYAGNNRTPQAGLMLACWAGDAAWADKHEWIGKLLTGV